MLSSLPGVAVVSVKIEGVLHEFSTIPGVVEDVTEIILNLKGLSAQMHTTEQKVVTLNVTGPATVTAGDIYVDSEVEILNPDMHICTVNEDGSVITSYSIHYTKLYDCNRCRAGDV